MAEIIQHIVNYSLDELKEIAKNGEVFRKYPKNPNHALLEIREHMGKITADIEVSSLGRIKINGNIVTPFEKEKGWFYVTIQENVPDYRVWRLVAETWLEFPYEDTEGWVVHHIVNEGKDIPENLIWIKNEIHLKIH